MPRDLAFAGLSERFAAAERDRSVATILVQLTALATGAPAHEAQSEERSTARGARARQIAIYLASVVLNWPCERISLAFGRARSTISYACHRVEELRDDPAFDARLESWGAGIGTLLEEYLA